jgi:tetratricopeptide (TPR) repeat protein
VARDRSPGRHIFEEAYTAEKENPATAIKLYREALDTGLSRELAQAARWRLFYLYRQSRAYGEALETAGELGSDRKLKNVLGDLYAEIAATYRIPETAAREYAAGLRMLARNKDADALPHFERALRHQANNEVFRQEITRLLIQRGRSAQALALLERVSTGQGVAGDLARADLLVKLGRGPEALRLLGDLAVRANADGVPIYIAPQDRSQMLYLLGRIVRRTGARGEAIRYFRQAAREAAASTPVDPAMAARMQGLAAYGLYREGHTVQARSLLETVTLADDFDVNLLLLVLRAEVDEDTIALRKLRALAPELRERKRSGHGSYLINRALELSATDSKGATQRPPPQRFEEQKTSTATLNDAGAPAGGTGKPAPERETTAALTCWQRDFEQKFGSRLRLRVPKDRQAVLFRNPDALQFHGYGRSRGRLSAQLHAPLPLPEELNDLSSLLRAYRGDFVILLVPRAAPDSESEPGPAPVGTTPGEYSLARVSVDGQQSYYAINLRVDESGEVTVELEKDVDDSEMPEYWRGNAGAVELLTPAP